MLADIQTAKTPPCRSFHHCNTTYSLHVTLDEGVLGVELEDFKEWVVYGKEYCETDVGAGGQISRKMELIDVFMAFQYSKGGDDVEGNEGDGGRREKVMEGSYEYGQVIKRDETLCYKIDKNGIVTCFMNYFDRRTKTQVILESRLSLNLIRKLDSSQIFLRQASIEKEKVMKEFSQQVEEIKKEKDVLAKKLALMEAENAQIRQEAIENKKEIEKINEVLGFYKLKFTFLNQNVEKVQEKIECNRNQVQKSMRREIKSVSIGLKDQFILQMTEIKQQMLRLVQLFQSERTQNMLEQNRLKIQLTEMHRKLVPFEISGLPQPNLKYFQIARNQLTYTGESGKCTHFIFNQTIPKTHSYSFKIRIVRSPATWIMVGIVDERQLGSRNSYNSNNAICYYSGGEKYPSGMFEGQGFDEGNIVETSVDLVNRVVKWTVKGVVRASYGHDVLGEPGRVWRPFVEVYYQDDVVEWVCE